MGGKTNRTRGFNLEREAVNEAKALGLTSKRMWGSDGRTAGLDSEVDVIIDDKHFQCKRKRRLPAWFSMEHVEGIIVRQDQEKALVIVPLSNYLALLATLRGKTSSSGE